MIYPFNKEKAKILKIISDLMITDNLDIERISIYYEITHIRVYCKDVKVIDDTKKPVLSCACSIPIHDITLFRGDSEIVLRYYIEDMIEGLKNYKADEEE